MLLEKKALLPILVSAGLAVTSSMSVAQLREIATANGISIEASAPVATATLALTPAQVQALKNAKSHLQKFKGTYEEWSSEFEGATFVKSTVETSKAGKQYARAELKSSKGSHYTTLNSLNKALASAGATFDDVYSFSFDKISEGVVSDENPLHPNRFS